MDDKQDMYDFWDSMPSSGPQEEPRHDQKKPSSAFPQDGQQAAESKMPLPYQFPQPDAKNQWSFDGPGPPTRKTDSHLPQATTSMPNGAQQMSSYKSELSSLREEKTTADITTAAVAPTSPVSSAIGGDGVNKVMETVAEGKRTLAYFNRTVSIPLSKTPDVRSQGFGYYVEDKDGLLYFPVGETGPRSLLAFSDFPPSVVVSVHQVMNADLAKHFNGDWKSFMLSLMPTVTWLRLTNTDEGDRIAEALYVKGTKEFPEFSANVAPW